MTAQQASWPGWSAALPNAPAPSPLPPSPPPPPAPLAQGPPGTGKTTVIVNILSVWLALAYTGYHKALTARLRELAPQHGGLRLIPRGLVCL
jgi:hypothetical protein